MNYPDNNTDNNYTSIGFSIKLLHHLKVKLHQKTHPKEKVFHQLINPGLIVIGVFGWFC